MTKKKRERKERRLEGRPAMRRPAKLQGTVGELRGLPETAALEQATGNKMRVREMPDGSVMLDFSTPRG